MINKLVQERQMANKKYSMRGNKILLFTLFLTILLLPVLLVLSTPVFADGACSGTPISIPGVQKKLIPLGTGRQNQCMKPKNIIMHTTDGKLTAEDTYTYFAGGASGRNVASQFVVGNDGKVIQMGELTNQGADIMYHVAFNNTGSIGIEQGATTEYSSKNAAPQVQYQASLKLVQFLMKEYNIKPQDVKYGPDWIAPANSGVSYPSGIYGHYQLNPLGKDARTDPGQGWMKDFFKDLGSGIGASGSAGGNTTSCVITKVGNPTYPSPTLPPECNTGSMPQ